MDLESNSVENANTLILGHCKPDFNWCTDFKCLSLPEKKLLSIFSRDESMEEDTFFSLVHKSKKLLEKIFYKCGFMLKEIVINGKKDLILWFP